MHLNKKGIILLVLFIFLLYTPSIVEARYFSLDKTKERLSIKPGQSVSGIVRVENLSAKERQVRAYLEDWVYTQVQDGSKEFFPAGTTELSCAEWISFLPAEFILPPYGRTEVSYVVRVPADAKGGHYAVFFFEAPLVKSELPELKEEEITGEERRVGIDVALRLGLLFYVEAEGTVNREAELSNFSVDKSGEGLEIAVDFKNTGNVDIMPGCTFDIMDAQSSVYARGKFDDVYTFPGDKSRISSIWKEPLPNGRYDLILTLDLGKAAEEMGVGSRGPVVLKEAEIEIGAGGQLIRVGELR